jgi:hypothetical protein
MTFTITLEPDAEAVIERRAVRRGMTVAEYLEHMAISSVRKRSRSAASAAPKTPAETVEYWRANNLTHLFNDALDSPELARELRRRAETRTAE